MQQTIQFSKMHGLGNDFIVVDGISQSISIQNIPISKLADRHSGIGFDQLLLIESSKQADFACRIFNSDGSEAEQCGNGMRCVARFLYEKKLHAEKSLRIETKAGVIAAIIHDFDHIQINMGKPRLEPDHELKILDKKFQLSVLSMGNPHVVLQVTAAREYPVAEMGTAISTHKDFPHGTNVGFMEIVNRQTIRLRTFERGAGETLACGSNSCAAVVAGIEKNLLDHKVKVELALGSLWIEWAGGENPVFMTGPAEHVFEGECPKLIPCI